ncbi:MAG: YncE family protein [Desulfobacteraceae bacterium]|nr:YncE family protein [Desulfobacteraceae bacterium]
MKKLSMILTVLIIFGTSAIGYTSDEYVVFEGIFERGNLVFERAIANKKTGKKGNGTPVSQFGNFLGSSGEATLRVCNVAEADKISSATISINGNVVLGSSNFNQNVDCIKKTVNLMGGDNILEVQLKSKPGGKVSIEILQPDIPPAGDVCGDTDDGYPNTVIATTTVGPKYGPYGGIAVSPDEEFAYVSNFMEGTVSVINTSDNSVIDEIPVGSYPVGISVTPDDGLYAYVCNLLDDTVSVIRTEDNTVIDTDPSTVETDPIPVGEGPFGISVTPDGGFAYVTNYYENTVSVIDTAINKVIDTDPSTVEIDPITVGNEPAGISMTPDGAYAYVSNSGDDVADDVTGNSTGDGTVSVIRTCDNTVVDTIQVGKQPYGGIAVSPDGMFVYVGNFEDGTVSVIGISDETTQ